MNSSGVLKDLTLDIFPSSRPLSRPKLEGLGENDPLMMSLLPFKPLSGCWLH